MSPNDEKAFVRAKPTKIVIEEQYHYKADVQENLALFFEKDKSQGEIKVEFVYDGEHLPSGWERAVLLQGLQNKWKLPGWIRNRIRERMHAWRETRFIGPAVGGVCWLFRWVWRIIWGLPGYLIRQYFKLDLKPDPSRSFGAPALADVEKCGADLTRALVGYLALRGYSKPAFDEDWPEHCTLPLEIPVDDLKSKMGSSRKYVITHRYPLQEPLKEPVRLGSVSLSDDIPHDKRSDLDIRLMDDVRVSRTDMGEMLWLKIPLIVDIEPPDLNERNQIELDVAKELWKKGKKWKESQGKQATTQENNEEEEEEEEPPFADQLAFFPEWDNSDISEELSPLISKELSRLSRRRGGYLFVTIDSEKDEKADEKAIEKLQKEMLKIALMECNPPVPIMMPYAVGRRSKQQLAIVPVPQRVMHSSGYRLGPIQIKGHFTYDGSNVTKRRTGMGDEIEISWRQLISKSDDSLARALVALANADDGYIIVELGPMNGYDKILETFQLARNKIIEQARSCVPPMMSLYISRRPQLVNGRAVLTVSPPRLPYAFTHQNEAWTRKGGKIEKMEINDIYKLFEERNELHYPTLVDPPVVTCTRIEWPHMDYRKRQGIRHDPDNRALEWTGEETMQQTSHDVFETTLTVQIMHPIELYQMGHLRGQIRVRLDKQILSGLDAEYFDATGQRHPDRNERGAKVEKSTTVVIHLDITLNAVFERRPFYPYRRLEFEGVKPDPDRLADIQNLLAELGLEDINAKPIFPFDFQVDLSDPATFEEIVSNRGGILISGHGHKRNLQVKLKLEGFPQTISRRRKNGKRIDRMQVPTGQLRITLIGEVKGESPLELSTLLNQIQHLLKERFNLVRMHLQ